MNLTRAAEQASAARSAAAAGVDFTIFTSAMELGSWHGAPVVNMVGSSTIRDLKGDVMLESALRDMEQVTPGLVIWLNHDYSLPDSLFGGLVKSPHVTWEGPIADLHITSDVELENPDAARVYSYIKKGRKLGCSIGCRVDKASIDAELFEKSGELALLIESVTTVEWSVVGIPCNQRSWVETAIKGYVSRSLTRNPTGTDLRMAQVMKSLWPKEYGQLTKSFEQTRPEFAQKLATLDDPHPSRRFVVWDPSSASFAMKDGTSDFVRVDRALVEELVTTKADVLDPDPGPRYGNDGLPVPGSLDIDDLEELAEESAGQLLVSLDPEADGDEHPEAERNSALPAGEHTFHEQTALPPSGDLLNSYGPGVAIRWQDAGRDLLVIEVDGLQTALRASTGERLMAADPAIFEIKLVDGELAKVLKPEHAGEVTTTKDPADGDGPSRSGDKAHQAQAARAKKYGISAKDGGHVTKPGKWKSVPDSQWGDPVNYRYPMPDESHARNALSRWGDASNRSQYSKGEQATIGGRIRRRAKALGVSVSSDSSNSKSLKEGTVLKRYTFKHLPVYEAGERVAGLRQSFLVSKTTQDDVELLTPEQVADAESKYASAAARLSTAQLDAFAQECTDETVAGYDAEAAAAYKAERKAAAKAARAAARATKLASAEQLVSGTSGSPESATPEAGETPAAPAEDPIRAARLMALKALAEDLGITVKSSKITLPDAESDAKRDAAALVLKSAYKVIKSGAAISADNMAKLQLAHDALNLVTDGMLCKAGPGSENAGEPGMALAQNLVAGVPGAAGVPHAPHAIQIDTKGLVDSIDALKLSFLDDSKNLAERLAATRAEVEKLEQMARNLKEMPLGNPTQSRARTVVKAGDATWADMAEAGNAPAAPVSGDVLAGTEIVMVKRGSGEMKMRRWPAGYLAGQRPELDSSVMPYMLMKDILAYRDGGQADVPELD